MVKIHILIVLISRFYMLRWLEKDAVWLGFSLQQFHDMYTKHYWCDQMKIILGKYWGLRKLNVDLENN